MKNKRLSVIAFLIFCNIVAGLILFEMRQEKDLEVIFFDVGQGDAALIRTPAGHNILIDGGPSNKILPHLRNELSFWEKEIDLIILSHAHADHLSGLVEVLKRYDVGKVLWNKQEADTLIYRQWEQLLEGVPQKRAFKGQRIDLGEAYLDVLYPPEEYLFPEDLNEASVINRLIHESGAVLFTGDAYKSQERKLLKWEKECTLSDYEWCRVMDLSANVLKAGHHGSSTSSDYDFVKRVNPDLVVISAGKDNRYGHPHKETVDLFNDLNIEMYKTFKDGNLRIIME